MVVIDIDIISDVTCIWCFIGKRTLEKAVLLYQKTYPGGKDDIFRFNWRPYYLNQNPSTTSVEKSELSKIKFQGVNPDKMAAMHNRVNQICAANGIKFSFGGKIGTTREAHRLIHLTQQNASAETQNELVEKLFQGYQEKELDISEPSVLKDIAIDAGLDAQQVDAWLTSDEGRVEVDEAAQNNRKFVTTGVPTFIIQNKYRVDGAQDLQEFFESFVKVREAE